MTGVTDATAFDVIVIGSGIGGLACAVAPSRSGRKVLVLEQHFVAGGLTQTFSREGFTWDVGLHYLGDMHEGGGARRVLDWLSDEAIHFSPVGVVYDTVHFPEGFEVLFPRTQAALKLESQESFPASRAALEAYFSAVEDAAQLPKKTSPGCTSAREFRVILLCPTVLFGAQMAATPSRPTDP